MSNQLELKVVFAAVDKFLRPVAAITKGASAAAKAMREQQSAASQLNGTLSKIDAYEKLTKDAAIANNVIKKTTAEITQLKEAIAKAGKPTAEQSAELEKLTQKLNTTSAKVDRFRTQEIDLRTALKLSGVETDKLATARDHLSSASSSAAMNSQRLQKALDAENDKMKRLRAAQADLAKSRETAGKLAGFGARAMAGGAAINAAASVPVMAYAKAEDAATQLQISMMQKGGTVSALYGEINALATRLGNKLPGTTADYQDMMTMLVRQGMPAKNIIGGLGEATAYLAVQLKMAPTAAAEFASKLQDATRTADKDMMGLMDTIQRTFYLGVDQNNMLQGFAKLSPALSIIKKEGAEAARALAPLLVLADQSGMQGEASGNAFRKIFQLALDAKKVGKGNAELAGTGVKLDFSNGKGEFGGLDKMYAQLEQLRGVNTQQRLAALKKIFGDDAETLQALTLMIEKGVAGYREVQAKMEAQAAIQERVNKQLGTLKSLWDAATGTFTNALVAFGESISPELHATAEWLGTVAERTQKWAQENPGLAGGIMTVVKWLGLAALGIGALALGISGIIVPLAVMKFSMVTLGLSGSGALGLIATGIGTVGRALLLNPIGLTLTAIATAATLIYANWDKIGPWFSGVIDKILGKLAKLRDFMHMIGLVSTPSDRTVAATTTATISASPLIPRVAAGANYNINITTQPGTDNNGLGAALRQELDRIEREKATRNRSRLRDME